MLKLIAISADFDPVHKGHEKLIKEGRKLADEKQKKLVVYLNKGYSANHSPFFVNALSPEEVWVLQKQEDGFSTITRASDFEYVKQLCESEVELGDLWYSNYFG